MKTLNNANKFMETRPNAVFFDLDNTLYDYDFAHHSALMNTAVMAERLMALSKDKFMKLYEDGRRNTNTNLRNTAASHSRLLYFQYVVEVHAKKTEARLVLQLQQCYWHHFLANAELYSGVLDVLSELRMLRIPAVIVTNLTVQIQLRKIVKLKLDPYFDFIVTSEEVGVEKPDAKVFLKALEKLCLKQRDLIWMIGDCVKSDMEGAKRECNSITIQKVRNNNRISRFTDILLNEFSSLLAVIEGFKNKVV